MCFCNCQAVRILVEVCLMDLEYFLECFCFQKLSEVSLLTLLCSWVEHGNVAYIEHMSNIFPIHRACKRCKVGHFNQQPKYCYYFCILSTPLSLCTDLYPVCSLCCSSSYVQIYVTSLTWYVQIYVYQSMDRFYIRFP